MSIYEKYASILSNPRIAQRINELKLTEEQIEDAIPILIDMANEDEKELEWLTSFKLNSQGDVVKTQELSKKGQQKSFMKNIVTRNIEPFIIDDGQDLIKDKGRANFMVKLKQILEHDPSAKKGLYVYGDYGVGKTYLMKRLAKKLAIGGSKIAFISTQTLSQEIKKTFSSTNTGTFSLYRITDLVKEADYLFLDDIGAESISAWFRDDCLFPILNYRMQRELPTFFTSNFSLEKLEKKESTSTNNRFRETDKSKRLISRIKALAEEVEIYGTNKR